MGRRRAWVLIGVHVAFAIHIAFFHSKGRALSPVEPSESMQTLEYGALNAGFIFFVLAILSTFLFGRFFCGWGCHLVALQDVCSVLLKKIGIRPKPFRSRILVWVPMVAALYMFLWPSVLRMLEGRASPKLTNHLQTENFWVTFGNPVIGVLTLTICGFLAVIFLGNKGFCTYACPYGAFFGVADKFSPGRIRVTDACDQCGQCTAHCSSNVRVHEEVKLHQMVVDAGCMKCLDCIDHCPKQALYFGFGKVKTTSKGKRSQLYDLTWAEEAIAAIAFIVSLYAYRGLYGQVPFLMALGISGLMALGTLTAVQLATKPRARLHRWQLKEKGKLTRSGLGFGVAALVLFAYTGQSAFLQYTLHEAQGDLESAQRIYDGKDNQPLEVAEQFARSAKEGFSKAVAMTPIPVSDYFYRLGAISEFLGEPDEAQSYFERTLELSPDMLNAIVGLARTYESKKEWDKAKELANRWIDLDPNSSRPHFILAQAYTAENDFEVAIREYEWMVLHDPKDAEAHTNMALLLGLTKRYDKAEIHFKEAIALRPAKKEFVFNYGLMLAEQGRVEQAFTQFDQAIKLDGEFEQAYLIKVDVALKHAKWSEAIVTCEQLLEKAPFHPQGAKLWAFAVIGGKQQQERLNEKAVKPGEIYRMAALLHAVGKLKEADAMVNSLSHQGRPPIAPW